MAWSYNLDGDPVHPDWEYTMDGEYRPKNVGFTLDGDMLRDGKIVTQKQFDQERHVENAE